MNEMAEPCKSLYLIFTVSMHTQQFFQITGLLEIKSRENADCLIRFSAALEAFVVRDEARPLIPLYYFMLLVLPTPRNQGIRVSDRGKKKRICLSVKI